MDKLTPKLIVALIVRLFAIGLLIYLVRGLVVEFSASIHAEKYAPNILLAVVVVFIVFLVAFLWKFPLFVASKLLTFEVEDKSEPKLSEQGFYTLGFVLLGIWLMYLTISDTAYWWYRMSAIQDINQKAHELDYREKAMILSSALKFVMSLFLLVGARKISQFFFWLRHAKT